VKNGACPASATEAHQNVIIGIQALVKKSEFVEGCQRRAQSDSF
jgi:hypothetical protein